MSSSISTYREIARLAECSIASVSYALCNRPGVSSLKRKHILDIAKRLGYKPNPMVTALMVRQRLSRKKKIGIRSIVAYLENHETYDSHLWSTQHSNRKDHYDGAVNVCEEFGYLLEKFDWSDFKDKPFRLFAALRARNIRGVIIKGEILLEPAKGWERYALSYAGVSWGKMQVDSAGANLYYNTWMALEKLIELGYTRIGFIRSFNTHWLEVTQYVSQGAYLSMKEHLKGRSLFAFDAKWDRKRFLQWIQKKRPQVIVVADHMPLECLREEGVRIPDDIGFVHIDLDARWNGFSGVYQNHIKVGEAAAHLVIDRINRNCYGMPDVPRSVLIPGKWVVGSSVKKM